MKIFLLIFTICLISDGGASKEVTGYSGGGVLIKCKYDTEYTQNLKYFCKGSSPGCSDLIKTGDKNMWVTSGRFSLFDDTKSAKSEFSVMIRELTVEDTGTYQCGVEISQEKYIYTPVELKVKEDVSFEKTINKTVHVRGDVNISCTYPESHKNDNKFLCKRHTTAACLYMATIKEDVSVGKFSLYDDREKHVFTVSLNDVTEQDSGEYWCGAVAWKQDHEYNVYFIHINLTVTGFSAFILIALWASLLVFLIGFIFLIVILYKGCKMQDPETMTPVSSETNGDYENVLHLQSTQNTNPPESVYQKLNPNTNQLDLVYQNMTLKTNQSDSLNHSLNPNTNQSDSLYQSLNPNTNQSDSLYQSLNPTPTNQIPLITA
ncbi:polymeric immunoglobulin receptor-like [Silurus meridionalis]|uniref:polymeric immunoglobulin receptor-like n=1 Tax=Silurus meridionalis TaxID=175797 RepID=UPI001EEC53C7|nr:polymeric immunoglobulin receptor-like [Silurus meridionalis]